MAQDLSKEIWDEINKQRTSIVMEIDAIFQEEVGNLLVDLEEHSPVSDKKYGEHYKEYWMATEKQKGKNGEHKVWTIKNWQYGFLTGILENGRIIKGVIKGRRPHIDKCRKRSEKRLLKKLGGK